MKNIFSIYDHFIEYGKLNRLKICIVQSNTSIKVLSAQRQLALTIVRLST
ncbi:MAG: hypothetical protein ACLVL2_00580 [Bacteroides cellulosilyticus]